MPATLAQLLALGELHLGLLTPPQTGTLDSPIEWAHSSDLVDPTPFLSPGHLLLTTATPDDADDYVSRLVAHGVIGLGFGTEVTQSGTPDSLIDACIRHGLALVEVPYHTPFIAIARFVADRVADDAYARTTWALHALRALSLAALRDDPVTAILSELAQQLAAPVVLLGPDAAVRHVFPHGALNRSTHTALMICAEKLLETQRRAADSTTTDDGSFTLQTLGMARHLRGVLAVTSIVNDAATQQVITGVVALIGLALEQGRANLTARSRLRTAIWRALLHGDHELAQALAEPVFSSLPTGNVRVTAFTGTLLDAAADWLENQFSTFFAVDDTELIILETQNEHDHTRLTQRLADRFELRGGLSGPDALGDLARALSQARMSRDGTTKNGMIGSFDSVTADGLFALLHTADARALADATLAPLVSADPRLPGVLRAWLDNDAVYDAAARQLGMHRHTLRAKITEAERVLGHDLTSFALRANLYAALITAEIQSPHQQRDPATLQVTPPW